MTTASAGAVIGFGSVGRRHARTLASLVPHLAIVDGKDPAREQAAQEHAGARVTADLLALDAAGFPWQDATVVIATWGPSHAPLFHALADRGVRRILCEKPMAASVCDAREMVARAESESIALGVHHYLRHARIVPALRRVLHEHALGEPVAVVVEGGAACLLTNGIHWLDFAIELFCAPPQSVVSTARGAPLNPRAPDLALYGGTAVWRFEDEREAVISFSNRSSLAPLTRVYLRDAVVEIDGELAVRVRRRDAESVARFPAVTRTGQPSVTLWDGPLPGVETYLDGMRAATVEVLAGGPLTCTGQAGAVAVDACIGALVAARDGREVALPLDPQDAAFTERWPIS
jgi:predicted dehydrogenase